MNDRRFLDTNIFVYTFDEAGSSKSTIAQQLVDDALADGGGVISYQVVQEFYNVAFRRFAKPMTQIEAQQYLLQVFDPLLRVQSSSALLMEAIRIRDSTRIAWYDALIIAAATISSCTTVLTEDLQHGMRFGSVRIINPFV